MPNKISIAVYDAIIICYRSNCFFHRYLRSGGAPDWFHARKQAEAVKWENFPEGVALWPEIFKV